MVYKKAQSLQQSVMDFVKLFPRDKTYHDLADQMSRSARSVTKNIVEGWKRNSTKEYYEFLGFSIGSNSELMEDLGDIVIGVYKELMGIKGIMGERGVMGREELDKIPFYPLSPLHPLSVKLFLNSKEINFLLYKLQKSLDVKMDNENTRPRQEKLRQHLKQQKEANKRFDEYLKKFTNKPH